MTQKTAIITGASRGLGRSLTKHLVKMGYRVGMIAKNMNLLKSLKQELIEEYALDIEFLPIIMQADVSNFAEISRAILNFIEATGSISVLVNNAGVLNQGTLSLDSEAFCAMTNTNVLGMFNCIKAVSPYMIQAREGYIFNISSTAGKMGFARLGGYSASKFGMMGLGESVLKELCEYGIKVTTLCPSLMLTDMTEKVNLMPSDKMIPLEDIGHTIEYLLKLSPNTIIKELSLDCSELICLD